MHGQRLWNVSILLSRCSWSILSSLYILMLTCWNLTFSNYNRFSTHFPVGSWAPSRPIKDCHHLYFIGHCRKLDERNFSSISTWGTSRMSFKKTKLFNNSFFAIPFEGWSVSIIGGCSVVISYNSNILSLEATEEAVFSTYKIVVNRSEPLWNEHVAMAGKFCWPNWRNSHRHYFDICPRSVCKLNEIQSKIKGECFSRGWVCANVGVLRWQNILSCLSSNSNLFCLQEFIFVCWNVEQVLSFSEELLWNNLKFSKLSLMSFKWELFLVLEGLKLSFNIKKLILNV